MSTSSHQDAPESAIFRSWATLVVRYRWVFLLMTLALTAFMAKSAADIKVDNSVEAFLSDDSEASGALEELRDLFGRDDVFLILAEGDVFSLPYLTKLRALHEEVGAIDLEIASLGQRRRDRRGGASTKKPPEPAAKAAPTAAPAGGDDFEDSGDDDFEDGGGDDDWAGEKGGSIVEEVISLINVRDTRWEGGGLKVEGLLEDPPTAAELPALKARVLADRTLVGQVVGKAGKHSAIVVRTDFMSEEDSGLVYDKVLEITAKYESDDFKILVGGSPAMNAALNRMMLEDLGMMFMSAILLMLLILGFIFRHPIGVLAPLVVVVFSMIYVVGTMALLGVSMTMMTNILPAFLICVGIGASVHIQSVYRDARADGIANEEAIIMAVASTGKPILYTTMTTFVGLLSFRFASLSAIQDMGTFGAIGVTYALLHTLVFLPVALTFNKKSLLGRRSGGKTTRIDRFLDWCNSLSRGHDLPTRRNRSWKTIGAGALLVIVAVVGASNIGFYHDPVSWMPEDSKPRLAIESLGENVGGTSNIAILMKANEGENLKQKALMQGVADLQDHVLAYRSPDDGSEIVGNTTSLADIVRESWRAMNEDDPSYYVVPSGTPDNPDRGVVDMVTMFETSGPEDLKRLATVDMKQSVIMMRVKWLDAYAYNPLVDHIEEGLATHIGDKADVKITGTVHNLVTIVNSLLGDLLKSFGMAFLVITLMMIVLLGDLKLGLVAMVPNLFPIALCAGVMGFTGIPIDMNNLLIASIAIGIAVDDTIHLLFQYKAHYTAYGDVDNAIAHAFEHSGRAMASTSVILVAGFLVYVISQMNNLQRFGLLVSMTVVFALLIDLIFAPALMRIVYRDKAPRAQERSPA